MIKPVGLGTARPEALAPVSPVPKSQAEVPARSRLRKSWVIGGLSALAVIVVGLTWWLSGTGGTIHYTTAPVTRGPITRAVTATGTVNPVLTIIVGSYVSGVI